jgi:hypothetical protein
MYMTVTHVYDCYTCIWLLHMYMTVTHVYDCYTCLWLLHMYMTVTHVYDCYTCIWLLALLAWYRLFFGARVTQWVRSLDLTAHTSLSPIRCGFASGFVNYKKWGTRLASACDKVYQLLAHGRWFSPGTPASSTTKTGRHDIAEMLL